MTKLVLLDSRLFAGGVDLSGSGNKIEIGEEWEVKETTNWRSGGAKENLTGLGQVDISAEGQLEQTVDEAFWAQRRTIEPWTAAPAGDGDLAVGGLMYLTRALRSKTTFLGEVGAVAPWSAEAAGSWPLVRGACVHPCGVPRIANGNGTAVQLGALTTGQYMYANLHVLSIAGTVTPTLTVTVNSDDNSGFSSGTSRGSFAAKTTTIGESIRIAGPITDDWWRLSWTITGTSPSFLFLVSMGIE